MTAVRLVSKLLKFKGFRAVGFWWERWGRGEAVQERLPLSEVWESWKDCAHVEASVLAR